MKEALRAFIRALAYVLIHSFVVETFVTRICCAELGKRSFHTDFAVDLRLFLVARGLHVEQQARIWRAGALPNS